MNATAHHHQNDDLWALGLGFAAGTAVLAGMIALAHQPAVQALIANVGAFALRQVQAAFPHFAPVR